jgi:hypothetical protein
LSTALVTLPKPDDALPAKVSRVDLLQKRYQKLQVRDLDIVDGMNRFAEIPTEGEAAARASLEALLVAGSDEQIRIAGWKNRQQLRAAFYGTLPRSRWPAAMQAAHERVGMCLRKLEKNANRQTFNLNVINIPAPQRPTSDEKVVIIEAKAEK